MRGLSSAGPLLFVLLAAPLLTPSSAPAKDPVKDVRWTRVKTRFVPLADGSPILEKVPLLPLLPNTDGRFLFGRTPGWKVAIDATGLRLKLDPSGREGGRALALAASGRLKIPCLLRPGAAFELPIQFVEKDGRWSYRIAGLLEVPGPGGVLCFLDADGDGWFDDLDVDRVALGAAAGAANLELKPFTGEVKLKDQRWLAYADLMEAGFWPISAGVRADYVRHAAIINELRKYAGLEHVGHAEELTPACEAHSRYCSLNNSMTHDEAAGRPGYSAAGHNAGMHSCLGGGNDADPAIRSMLRTLWHRNFYLSKSLTRVGVGCADGYFTSDVLSHGGGTGGRELVFAPPAGALDVELTGAPESPDPYPDGKPLPGPFVTVLLPPGKKLDFESGSIVPRGGGAPLEFAMCDPSNPPVNARSRFPDNDLCIALIPRQALQPETIYDVTVTAGTKEKPQVYRWSFRTGRAGR